MNTNTTERLYEIMNGPSRDTLFDACKYAYSKFNKIHVEFTVAAGYTMPKGSPGRAYVSLRLTDIIIAGIAHENGSGESFNLYGYCHADLNSFGGQVTYKNYYFSAYYNTQTRTGTIKFTE